MCQRYHIKPVVEALDQREEIKHFGTIAKPADKQYLSGCCNSCFVLAVS